MTTINGSCHCGNLSYQFETDFVNCGQCGIYVGAVIGDGDKKYITLNMNLAGLDVSRAAKNLRR
jgi:hypothetical protein